MDWADWLQRKLRYLEASVKLLQYIVITSCIEVIYTVRRYRREDIEVCMNFKTLNSKVPIIFSVRSDFRHKDGR
jgi:hypothetical protein